MTTLAELKNMIQTTATTDEMYPTPSIYEFVVGRDIDAGASGFLSYQNLKLVVGQIVLPTAPEITDNMTAVPGMYGDSYGGMAYGAKVISIPVTLIAEDEADFAMAIHNIGAVLITPNTLGELPLSFGIEPDVTYYGHFSELPNFEPEEGNFTATATLTFTASDPRGFLPQEKVTAVGTTTTITVPGTGKANPIIRYQFKQDVKQFGFQKIDQATGRVEFVKVGYDPTPSGKIVDTKPTVWKDTATTLSTWQQITDKSKIEFPLAGGAQPVNGTVQINPSSHEAIEVVKFSGDETKYPFPSSNKASDIAKLTSHGPLLVSQYVQQALNDWEVSARLNFTRRYDRADQLIELYLLDESGQRHARFGIDAVGNGFEPVGYMHIGTSDAVDTANRDKGLGYYGHGVGGSGSAIKSQENNGTNSKVTLKVATASNQKVVDGGYKEVTTKTEVWTGSTTKVTTTITERTDYTIDYETRKQTSKKTTPKKRVVTQKGTSRPKKDATTAANKKIVTHKKGDVKERYSHAEYNTYLANHKNKKPKWKAGDTKSKYTANEYAKLSVNKIETVNITNHATDPQKLTDVNNSYKSTTTSGTRSDTNKKWTNFVDRTITNNKNTKETVSTKQVFSDKVITVKDYNNDDVFSDTFVRFTLSQKGNVFEGTLWELNNDTSDKVNGRIGHFKYTMSPAEASKFRFNITQFALYMGKTPIAEDMLDAKTKKAVKAYKDNVLRLTDIKVSKLLSDNDLSIPHVIAKKGDIAVINTETEHVFIGTNGGVLSDTLLDIRSTFPALQGGTTEKLTFIPGTDKATITVDYLPSYK